MKLCFQTDAGLKLKETSWEHLRSGVWWADSLSLLILYTAALYEEIRPRCQNLKPAACFQKAHTYFNFRVWCFVHVCGRTCVWWCRLVLLWNWGVGKVISQTVRSISSRDSPSCSHPLQFHSRFGLILEDHIVSLLTRETCSLSACQLMPTREHSFKFQGLEMDMSKCTMAV